MFKSELADDVGGLLRCVSVIKAVDEVHSVPDTSHGDLADFEAIEGFSEGDHRLETEETLAAFAHAHRVVDGDEDLVVALARQSPPQPDLIVAVVTRDERNDFLHVEALAGLEVTLQVLGELGFEHYTQLFAQAG